MNEFEKKLYSHAESVKKHIATPVNIEREDLFMKKSTMKYSFSGVAAVIAILVLTATAFAAWFLLTPSEVANRFNDQTLSAAFNSEHAININASQTAGDYKFILMSIVSGSDITDNAMFRNGEISRDRTYAVVAVQKSDGSPFDDNDLMDGVGFYISPYVKGIPPYKLNSHILGGGGSAAIIDGVKYLLTECDNISMFADRGVYIGISEGFAFGEAFSFNEETGEIKPNPGFNGVSILFDLPLDPALADPVKAQKLLDDFWGESGGADSFEFSNSEESAGNIGVWNESN